MMAVLRDRPCLNSNFLVDLGVGDARAPDAGFAEVIFPVFGVDGGDARDAEPAESHTVSLAGSAGGNRLILRRGVTGALNLVAWWNKARRGRAPQRRSVKVELLGEDQATVVLTWRFRNARPLSLSYSPLNAAEGGVLMETIELAFDSVEIS